jgi:ABC-type transport system involved in cytochrome bd biosynthesis fused ATPase/permease subunit
VNADLICVMDKGRIVERGSHHDLLARGELYADLWMQQSVDAARKRGTSFQQVGQMLET